MQIFINEKEITNEQINQWKLKRAKRAMNVLGLKSPKKSEYANDVFERLSDFKVNISYQEMCKKLRFRLSLSTFMMKLCARITKKRRTSVTEIKIMNISAQNISKGIDSFMAEASLENYRINLSAYPEHYALLPNQNGMFEVIETPGNSPLPIRFFISFNDETGLVTPRDTSFQYQSTGVAKLNDGTIIGGVRHQFKEIEGGCYARLSVEFPAIVPKFFVKAHQWHLASEFSYWFEYIKDNKKD